jgi:hypothetical protein
LASAETKTIAEAAKATAWTAAESSSRVGINKDSTVAEAAETAARTVEGRTAELAGKEAKNSACQKQQRQQHDSRRKSSRIDSNRGKNSG